MSFHGSYRPEDCTFLLKLVKMATTNVLYKEQLIQSGEKHYSELLSPESAPGEKNMRLFYDAMTRNQDRFAQDIARLALTLASNAQGCFGTNEVVLVSLARAGTPVGVILHRVLEAMNIRAPHYSVSIIRDRGIDTVALDHILKRHCDEDIVFVDGWTGKGAIADQLRESVEEYNQANNTMISPELVAVADMAGVASLAATAEDYQMPAALLNSIVSGLISRSILNDDVVGPGDFHACVFYENLAKDDVSNWFVDTITPLAVAALGSVEPARWTMEVREELQTINKKFVDDLASDYGVTDRNRIKPGGSEGYRALTRRVPDKLLVSNLEDPDTLHLVERARDENAQGAEIDIIENPDMPCKAAVIIQTLGE